MNNELQEQATAPETAEPSAAGDQWAFLHNFPQPWHLSTAATLVAIIGFSLPWATIDDHTNPLNAAGLMAYYFTAHDTWQITKTSPIGALVSFTAPLLIVTSTVAIIPAAAHRQRVNAAAAALAIASLLFSLALLAWCAELLDPDLPRLGPFNMPNYGLMLVMVSNIAALGAYALELEKRPARRKAPSQED